MSSLIGTYVFSTLIYAAASEIFAKVLPMPKQILKIEDKKERSKQFCLYVASFPAFIFDTSVVLLGIVLFISYGGVTFGQENTPFMQFVLMVNHSLSK